MSTPRKITLLFSVGFVCAVLLVVGSGQSSAANPLANPAAPAASLTLLAQQDAYINESFPISNTGGENSLWVGRVSAQTRVPFDLHTLVWFDLSALPPGASIIAAKLQLYEISTTLPITYAISPYIVSQIGWDEATVTWKNAPPYSNLGDAAVAVDMTNGWKTWDVTNIVTNWVNGKYANYGIRLRGDGSTIGLRQFGSRNDPQLAPRLILRYATNPKPTRTPVPTWTPIPTATPTKGPPPTPTPVFPIFTYFQPPPIFIFYPPTIDLSIYGIEVTEGIQCFDTSKGLAGCGNNSLKVIAKKDATARIYLRYSGSGSSLNNVPVRLHLRANGVWYVVNTTAQARSTLSQADANYSANIWFNVSFNSDVDVDFWAEVDPNHAIAETIENNNCYPTPGVCSDLSYFTLRFYKRGTEYIVGQRIRYHPSGYAGNQYAGGWAVNGGGATWWNAVLPLRTNGINYSLASGYLDWTTPLDGSGQHSLISTLNLLWIQQNALSWWFGTGAFTGARHVYGWAPSAGYSGGHADMPIYPHAGGYGVVGIGSDAPGVSVDNPGSGALIFGHELTHDYNVYHTNTADACGSNDNNSDFPYLSSSIQEFGFNPDTGKVYDPATTHDLMSYCPSGGSKQGWISPFTWNKMYGKVPAAPSPASSDRGQYNLQPYTFYPAASGEALVVHVTISNPISNTNKIGGYLGDLNRIEPGLKYLPAPGDYSIDLHNGPSVLSSQTFTVSFKSEYSAHDPGDPAPTAVDDVAFIMPWVEGTTSITLVYSGTVLDSRAVSLYSPIVTITAPTQVVTWTSGSHLLTWNASDADADALTYAVLFSHDGGSNWQLLDTGLISTSYTIDANAMAGGNDVRFRVVASDGVNIGYDETDYPIVIPNKPPMPMITNPVSGTLFAPGDLVILQGMAIDLEDGTLPDGSLGWSSKRQGGVGLGPTVPLTGLLRGPQLVTLTGMDSNGVTATTTVSIYIGYRAYLPIVLR